MNQIVDPVVPADLIAADPAVEMEKRGGDIASPPIKQPADLFAPTGSPRHRKWPCNRRR